MMKTFFIYFFVTLGVIFFAILLGIAYFFVADPYNLKPILFGSLDQPLFESHTKPSTPASTNPLTTPSGSDEAGTPSEAVSGSGFTLSTAQKDALISLGIDPATVPASITAEQEACFVDVLGTERVTEIKAGAVPNAFEFLKAKSCI